MGVEGRAKRNYRHGRRTEGGQPFRPDIIVHRRLSNKENVLVVETKARAQRSGSDEKRLRELTAELGVFRYWAGAFVIFFNRPRTVLRTGVMRVTVQWFTDAAEEPVEFVQPVSDALRDQILALI